MRLLHGADRWTAREILRQGCGDGRRQRNHHGRRVGHARSPASAAAGLPRRAGRPMRLLPSRHPDFGKGAHRPQPRALAARDRRGSRRAISAAAAVTPASCAPWRSPPSGCARGRGRKEERHERRGLCPAAAIARRQSAARAMGWVRPSRGWSEFRPAGSRSAKGC